MSSTGILRLPVVLFKFFVIKIWTIVWETVQQVDQKVSRNLKSFQASSNGYEDDSFRLKQITSASELYHVCPIKYVYDYIPAKPPWLSEQQIRVSDVLSKRPDLVKGATKENSIVLTPEDTKLPIHTGLATFRQNKHWKANERATRELLQLFADDVECKSVMLGNGKSMATLARKQLQGQILDTYSRFSIYMFADADEKRIQLLAQAVILLFIFDDMWEYVSSSEMNKKIRDDFIGRIQGNVPYSIKDTPLQKRMHDIRQGFLDGDAESGDGGMEVLQKLIDFCRHKHPGDFVSIREYLDYRYHDVANEFVYACTKFSLKSSVDLYAEKYTPLLGYIGDQISIANDLASYDKEVIEFAKGSANEMINFVHTIMQIERIQDPDSAKAMAYAKQLWTEGEILKELKSLRDEEKMSFEEWRFIDACLVAASGNLLTSIVIDRYGGEKAKLK